ncbi:TrkH family potassium uptake protein [Haloarchaeobius iranensis]|uniref:Trk system potassium uptake protein TrkH n=1 Tax=Haloarchaeobius iranensis TaxID=996166 RepID=A0A1G9T206_9EURY|nr:TrkH family potassium uptake protein [Haloarchaeobius iranensis]SDM41690.1 trk system potassium uptake protein TrkH [Haloarchaeobius iranensis]
MKLRVDWRAGVSLVGTVLKYLAVTMVVPIVTGLVYGDAFVPYILPFFVTAAIAVGLGAAMERLDPDPDIGAREGLLMVSLTWLVVSIVGVVPYVLEGLTYQNGQLVYLIDSTLHHPENALFESMSGFTTTGATVMGTIDPTYHSRGLMLWRQMTQWLGGMGIVVLAVAILPELSVGGAQLMDAEAPGPGIEKLTPRIAETARALWVIYAGITLVEILLLYGLNEAGMAPNMTPYNAISHGFTTMSTGGFSPEARSIEAFGAAVQWLIVPFMVAAGTSFPLFWHVSRGNVRKLVDDPEFRLYTGVMGALSALVAGFLFVDVGLTDAATEATRAAYEGVNENFLPHTFPIAGDVEAALRQATFQAVSLTTSTGYATMDFNTWSGPAKYALVFAMFIGGSAGSTGGGIKVVRWLVILKSLRRELFSTVHPSAVKPVRLGGRSLDERAIRGIYGFTLLYIVIFFVGALVLAADAAFFGAGNLAVDEAITASAATLGNIGPGLGAIGPMGSYIDFTPQSKLFMVGLMWVGRLEIFPVLVLLTRAYWQS